MLLLLLKLRQEFVLQLSKKSLNSLNLKLETIIGCLQIDLILGILAEDELKLSPHLRMIFVAVSSHFIQPALHHLHFMHQFFFYLFRRLNIVTQFLSSKSELVKQCRRFS